ncbi:adenylyl-sulfate kinase [Nocardioides aquiterrae]|uniref:Adenylyl-sulfate kinase n=1 Tax=Nocardioides aquiterrae TaxID=203799 RepID=A0ABN1UF02_9ACTN
MPPVPQHCPSPRELDDLELLVTGALVPTVVFNEPGSPVTLELPPEVAEAARAAGAVELVDPEGLPLAQVDVPGGTIEPLTHAQFGPFRDHYLTPVQTRERYAGRTFVPLVDALTQPQLTALATVGPVVLLPLVGHGTPDLSPVALIRATLAAASHLADAVVVAVPLASHGDPDVDHDLGVQVVANYAGDDPVVGVTDDPSGAFTPEIAAIVASDRPAPEEQGLVLFFTGLSGSGKSTLARALMDRLLEHGGRTLTSLDGDVVRRNLSAGLTFSKEDRETNIRRIGWVAAEISRHGGVAVCSPIAPFDATRQQVRAMVEQAGGAFFLVHVATPLEECERRDRKGLYAKARRGEIPEFTGISSPYEEPQDADVRVDTTGRTIEEALDDVLVALRDSGHLDLLTDPTPVVEEVAQQPSSPVVEEVAQQPSRNHPAPVVEVRGAPATTDPVVEVRGAPATSLETTPAADPVVEEVAQQPSRNHPTPVDEPVETPATPVVEPVETPAPAHPDQPADSGLDTLAGQERQEEQPQPVEKPSAGFQPRLRPTPPPPARTTAGGAEPPVRVLYICTANICRSPFMELYSRHVAGPHAGATFASAGTRGFDSRPMPPEMAATLTARGVPGVVQFRSRAFASDMIAHADLVLCAETAHRQFILDDHPATFRKVFTLGQFAEAVRSAPPMLWGRPLLEAVAERRGTANPDLDVPDPFGQGPEAAGAAAAKLEELLRVALPALTGSRKITS